MNEINTAPVAEVAAETTAPVASAKKPTPKTKTVKKTNNKLAKVKATAAKKDADPAAAKERAAANTIGITVRGFRILKAVRKVEARLTYAEIAAKSGVVQNHLAGQLWGEGTWGAGENALGKKGLVRRFDTELGVQVGLTAKGAKALESVK